MSDPRELLLTKYLAIGAHKVERRKNIRKLLERFELRIHRSSLTQPEKDVLLSRVADLLRYV